MPHTAGKPPCLKWTQQLEAACTTFDRRPPSQRRTGDMDNTEIRCSDQVITAIKNREVQGFVHYDQEAAIITGVAA